VIGDPRQDPIFGAPEFFELSTDNLCLISVDGTFVRLNRLWTTTLGWTMEELLGRPSLDFIHPEDWQATLHVRERLRQGAPKIALLNRYRHKDQSYRWFEWRAMARIDHGLIYAAARDVTEVVEGREILRELTETIHATLDSLDEGVIAVDDNDTVVRMNSAAEKVTGWSLAEARGQSLRSVFRLFDSETGQSAHLPVWEPHLPGGSSRSPSPLLHMVARDGARLPVMGSVTLRPAHGQIRANAVLVFRGATSDKDLGRAEEQLHRQGRFASRLLSAVALTERVASEINNPLAYVTANLDVLLKEILATGTGHFPPDVGSEISDWVELVRDARQGTERIGRVVRGLRALFREQQGRRAVVDVRLLLEKSIGLASAEISRRARLARDYGEGTSLVDVDEARLVEVFVHLLVNAAEALPLDAVESNEIRIVTSTDQLGRVVIEIRDTGPGVPYGILEQVFDPFFTTKPVGLATGLGLSICHNIVTGMGGEISATSRGGDPGDSPEAHGTSLRVVLPQASRHEGQQSGGLRSPTT
jgi:PAS domain S-box-containing protein